MCILPFYLKKKVKESKRAGCINVVWWWSGVAGGRCWMLHFSEVPLSIKCPFHFPLDLLVIWNWRTLRVGVRIWSRTATSRQSEQPRRLKFPLWSFFVPLLWGSPECRAHTDDHQSVWSHTLSHFREQNTPCGTRCRLLVFVSFECWFELIRLSLFSISPCVS